MAPPKNEAESQPSPPPSKAKHKGRNYNLSATPADAEDVLRRVSSASGSNTKSAEGVEELKKEVEWLEAQGKTVGGPLQKIGDGKFLKLAIELAKILLAKYLEEKAPS